MPLYIHKKNFNIIGGYGNYSKSAIREEYCFEVNELIAKPIQILNRKGYFTGGCCAGHPFVIPVKTHYNLEQAHHSSITFKEGISLPSLPPGFVVRKHDGEMLCIDKWYDTNNEHKCLRDIFETMEILHKWAYSLPDFKVKID